MAIGVAFVCRAAGKAEPEQTHDVARGIGEVVESVGDEGDGAGEQTRDALGQAQGDVEANADEACGKTRVGAARCIDRLVLAAGNKRMYQPIYK